MTFFEFNIKETEEYKSLNRIWQILNKQERNLLRKDFMTMSELIKLKYKDNIGEICVNDSVKVLFLDTLDVEIYTIVPEYYTYHPLWNPQSNESMQSAKKYSEANLNEGTISEGSALGKALLGHIKGDEVNYKTGNSNIKIIVIEVIKSNI